MLQTYTDAIARAAEIAQTQLEAKQYAKALNTIYAVVERVITDPITVCEYYGDARLDALCAEIGNRVFMGLPPQPIPTNVPETYAYIATKLQRSGGHTRVLIDFMRARPHAHHVILLTGSEGKSAEVWLKETLADMSHFSLVHVPRGNTLKALEFMQAQLIAFAPAHTYLFNHHADSVAVAALAPAMKLSASFCHHGDHLLCLGVFYSHCAHIDLHPMGYHMCRDNLHVNNRYVPFTMHHQCAKDPASFMTSGILTTATAGGANKIEQPYPISYFDVIPKLLAATGGQHIHFGRLSKVGLKRLQRGLVAHGVAPERFTYIPWVPSIQRALIEHHVDFYIASFPYGGGMTLIETMSAGIPSASHRHLFHRALGGFDLAYEGAFSWRDPKKLITYCTTLTPEILVQQHHAARAFYNQFHRYELLADCLDMNKKGPSAPSLSRDYFLDEDAKNIWRKSASSVRDTLWLLAYRTYRHVRRMLARIH